LAEVENLLVKLGEIPPKGGRRDTVRVIDSRDGKEAEELMERIRRAWPTIAPNPLLVTPPPEGKKSAPKPADDKIITPQPDTKSAGLQPVESDSLKLIQYSREENALRAGSKEQTGIEPPPVEIRVDAEGRIVISSDDTAALDAFEELATQYAPARKDYSVFKLKYASPYSVALYLEDFFKESEQKQTRSSYWDMWYPSNTSDSKDDRSSRLSKRRPLKFISDTDTCSILVENADAAQLKTIGELISIYDQPLSSDSQSVRKTETIHLEHSKAKAVADAVKDVYRDLLSANDKALQGAKSSDRDSSRTFIYDFSGGADGGKTEQKIPKFKGQLSIGVDELSNSLAVSAPAYLFEQIHKLIMDLDQAAGSTSTIKVVKLGQGLSGQQARDVLTEVLGQGVSTGRKTQTPNSAQPQPSNRQKSKGNSKTSSDGASSK